MWPTSVHQAGILWDLLSSSRQWVLVVLGTWWWSQSQVRTLLVPCCEVSGGLGPQVPGLWDIIIVGTSNREY